MSKLNGMQIFELLSNVNDNLIVESVSPALLAGGATGVAAGVTAGASSAGAASVAAKTGFGAWLAKGGWLALLAGVLVAAAVAVGVTMAGRGQGSRPPVGEDTATEFESMGDWADTEEPVTETPTEEVSEETTETESETESETKPDPENCAHSFGNWQFTVIPTCTEGGVRSRVCPLCDSVEDEDMPAGLHVFDDNGFCKSCHVGRSILSFTSNGDGTCSVGRGDFTQNKSDLVIPNYSPDWDLVVSIEPEAFADMTLLRSVTFPERLYSIGDRAFNSCSKLSGVTLPEGIAVIGVQAFYGCGLTEITFPASLYKLESGAFSSNPLTEVFLPATITELGGAFSLCDKLTKLTFEDGFVLEAVPTGLVTYCTSLKEITLPDTVTAIERYAFANSGLVTVHGITDKLTYIGEIAFFECKDLTDFTIPASVTYVGVNAFKDCDSLTYTVFEGCRYLAVGDNPHAILMGPEDTELTEVVISPDTRFINGSAFQNCTRLQSVVIPEGVRIIHTYTFKGCTRLQSVSLPSILTEICDGVFAECALLESVDIPDGVTFIGEGAFLNCTSLTTVKLPAALTAIEKDTFNECRALTAIDIPAGVLSIGENAFYQCRALSSVTLPEGLETIGDFAFYCCNFTSLTMPDSVTYLGVAALSETALQSIRLSSGLTLVEKNTFEGCGLLTEIIIPEGIEKIDMQAITSCYSLKRISLPRSLKTLMRSAMMNSACEEIDYAGTLEEWGAIVKQNRWYGSNSDLVIHCTDGDTTVSE